MKNLLHTLFVATVMLFSTMTSAAIFQVGDYQITSTIYIDTTSSAVDTFGIGRIDSISNINGVYWSSGDNGEYLNFNFSGYQVDPSSTTTTTGALPVTNFETLQGLGSVEFWLNDSTIFDAGQSYVDQKTAQETGSLYIKAIESGITSGASSDVSYNANGYLDIIGGIAIAELDTNSLLNFLGNTADMSFNISADNNHFTGVNAQYTYSGSSDSSGSVNPVPAPAAIWLLSTGLLGMVATRRKVKA